jgi:hypothetical protein
MKDARMQQVIHHYLRPCQRMRGTFMRLQFYQQEELTPCQ